MCGIIIHKGKEIEIKQIFDIALLNKHRGHEDGFGYYDFSNKEMVKTILHLDEVKNDKLSGKRTDKKGILKLLDKRLAILKEGLNKKTGYMIFHHRKASAGEVSMRNTHPIKIKKNIYYMHNGTIYGYWLLRNYLKLTQGKKYNGTTDTEFIGSIIEDSLRKNNDDYAKTYDFMKELLYSFGVIVRIDKKNDEIIIFKDTDRTLYLYKIMDSIMLISEPLFEIKEFDRCFRLDNCILRINKEGVKVLVGSYNNVTEKLRKLITKEYGRFKCDCCSISNDRTIRFGLSKDYCLSCLLDDKLILKGVEKTKTDIKETNIEYKKGKESESIINCSEYSFYD